MSLATGTPIWSASSFSLCQVPSFMMVKSFSLLNAKPLAFFRCCLYLSWIELLVESEVKLTSVFCGNFL